MSILDKLTGRFKQATGDVLNDPKTRREGVREERKGQAKEEEMQAEREAEARRQEASELDRKS